MEVPSTPNIYSPSQSLTLTSRHVSQLLVVDQRNTVEERYTSALEVAMDSLFPHRDSRDALREVEEEVGSF